MSCSCGEVCDRTDNIIEFLQQSGRCNLVVEAQWGVVTLVVIGFMFVLIVIESSVMIGYGCHYWYKKKMCQRNLARSTANTGLHINYT